MRRRLLYGAGAVLVLGLTAATVGVPALLVVAGAWVFAAAVHARVPALSGPTSWLAGVVVEATLLIAQSGVLALVAPHPHPQWVYVGVLVGPLVVAVVVYASAAHRGATVPPRRSGEPWLAVMALVLIEAMFEAIKLHGHDFGLTWFMTGDARNQVVGTRQILGAGGITLHEMTTYPAVTNAITAVVDGAGGRSDLSAAALMVRDVQAMVATVVLTCVGVALAFIAAVAETVERAHDARHLPTYLVIPLGACGSVSIGALFLGLGSSGGFLSAMGALVFALAGMVLGMRLVSEYDNVSLVLVVAALVLTVGSWTFLAVIPGVATVAGVVSGVRHLRARAATTTSGGVGVTRATVALALVALASIGGVMLVKGSTLVAQLQSPGGIVAGNARLFYGLGVVVLVAALVPVVVAPSRRQRAVRSLVLITYAALAACVAWMHTYHPGGVAWSYYATKMLWLATCAVAWVPFVVVADVVGGLGRGVRRQHARVVARVAFALVGSSATLWGISHETPYPFPWHWAFIGSTFPTPMMVQTVTTLSHAGEPFVFWQYSVPADDKLGDFWSALTWDYSAYGVVKPPHSGVSFPEWASAEQGSLAELCHVVSAYRLFVVTKNPALVPTLRHTCPGYRPVPGQTLQR